jgi:hypothetical protein
MQLKLVVTVTLLAGDVVPPPQAQLVNSSPAGGVIVTPESIVTESFGFTVCVLGVVPVPFPIEYVTVSGVTNPPPPPPPDGGVAAATRDQTANKTTGAFTAGRVPGSDTGKSGVVAVGVVAQPRSV